jgi:RNA-directed DNA polymerase
LGFTHICGKTRSGRYTVVRQTMRKRLQAKLGEVKAALRRRMHDRVPAVGKWVLFLGIRGQQNPWGRGLQVLS